MNQDISFSNKNPDTKIAPIIITGAAFLGRAIASGVISAAVSWETNRFLNSKFPSK